MLTRFQKRTMILGLFFIGSLVFTALLVAYIYIGPTDPQAQRDLLTFLIVVSLWEFFITIGMWVYVAWWGSESRKPMELLATLMSIFEPIVEFSMIFLEPVGDKIKDSLTWRREDKLAYFTKRRDEIQERIRKLEREKAKPEDVAKYKAVVGMIRDDFAKLLEEQGADSDIVKLMREYEMPYERKKKWRWPWGKKKETEEVKVEPEPEKESPCPKCQEKVDAGYNCPCGQRYHLNCLPHYCVMCGKKIEG